MSKARCLLRRLGLVPASELSAAQSEISAAKEQLQLVTNERDLARRLYWQQRNIIEKIRIGTRERPAVPIDEIKFASGLGEPAVDFLVQTTWVAQPKRSGDE